MSEQLARRALREAREKKYGEITLVDVNCKCGFRLHMEKVPTFWGSTIARLMTPHIRKGRWHGPVAVTS